MVQGQTRFVVVAAGLAGPLSLARAAGRAKSPALVQVKSQESLLIEPKHPSPAPCPLSLVPGPYPPSPRRAEHQSKLPLRPWALRISLVLSIYRLCSILRAVAVAVAVTDTDIVGQSSSA